MFPTRSGEGQKKESCSGPGWTRTVHRACPGGWFAPPWRDCAGGGFLSMVMPCQGRSRATGEGRSHGSKRLVATIVPGLGRAEKGRIKAGLRGARGAAARTVVQECPVWRSGSTRSSETWRLCPQGLSGARLDRRSQACRGGWRGSSTVKMHPTPGRSLTWMEPPFASIPCLAMVRPRPTPLRSSPRCT